MNKIKDKMEIVVDKTMEEAYQTYSLLKEEVARWQHERGSYWTEELNPAVTAPYYPLVDFPEMVIIELWKRLNRVIGVLIPESVLRETWRKFIAGKPVADPELVSWLQITVSGIAHLFNASGPDLDKYEGTGCPICGESAALSLLTPPYGKRRLHCTLCGHEWSTTSIGCIRCGSGEASEQNYLTSGEFPGIEVVACEACGQYFKELDLRLLSDATDYIWEDVRTLPLNYAAEQWLAEHAKASGKVQ